MRIVVLVPLVIFGFVAACSDPSPQAVDSQTRSSAALDALVEENEGDFYFALDAAGEATHLAAPNLAPHCTMEDTQADDPAIEALRCVIRTLGSLYSFDVVSMTENPDDVLVKRRTTGNSTSITFRPAVEGKRVAGSTIRLTTDLDGNIVQVMGQWLDSSLYRDTSRQNPAMTDDALATATSAMIGSPTVVIDRYFDPKRMSFVARFTKADAGSTQYLFDERSAVVFSLDEQRYSSHNLTAKIVPKSDYTNNVGGATGTSGGTINFNTVTNGSTCELRLDHGASHEEGEPFVTWYSSVDSNYSDTIYVPTPCASNATVSVGQGNDDIFNVYFWVHDLAVFSNSEPGRYSGFIDWTHEKPLRVAVVPTGADDCGNGACALLSGKYHTIQLARESGATTNLRTMAHEFGHTTHFRYGYTATHSLGEAVAEGFADQNVSRYTLYRMTQDANRPFDVMQSLDFPATDITAHEEAPKHGQLTGVRNVYDTSITDHCPGTQPRACGRAIDDIYRELAWNQCHTSYVTSTGFRCEKGQSIIADDETGETPDLPSEQAVNLANEAFTYAISEMEVEWGVKEFMQLVNYYYFERRHVGEITQTDFNRVLTVLNHHCLGFGNRCSEERILPGHNLPILRSDRGAFQDDCNEGDCGELVLAQEMVKSDGVTMTPHFEDSAYYAPSLRFATLDSPLDTLTVSLEVPATGLYRLFGSVRKPMGTERSMIIDFVTPSLIPRIDPGTGFANQYAQSMAWLMAENIQSSSEFVWYPSPAIPLNAGTQNLRLRYQSPIDIEAVYVSLATDRDNDGIADLEDNCPDKANFDQANLDKDRLGDVCDPDKDNDHAECEKGMMGPNSYVCNGQRADNCPWVYNPRPSDDEPQPDFDMDGMGDACDPDADGDGVVDVTIRDFFSSRMEMCPASGCD